MSLNRVYTDWMIVNALLIEHIMKAKSVDGRDWIIKKKKKYYFMTTKDSTKWFNGYKTTIIEIGYNPSMKI